MTPYKFIQVNINYGCNKNCSYCYAKDLKEDYEKDMTLDDFKDLLKWFGRNSITYFNITGGEPTIHPLVGDMLALADKEGFKVTIFTNGLFPQSFLKNIDYVYSFLINYNHKNTYTEKEYELLHKNLECIKQKGKPITLAFNITKEVDSCDYVIEAAKKYAAERVNMDLIIPNSLKSNEYISNFEECKNLINTFLEKFKGNSIPVRITRPLPFCIFKDEIRENKKVVGSSCSIGYGIVSINPDLSVFPCLSIFFRGPKITLFNNFEDVMSFYHNAVSDIKWKRYLYPECGSCVYLLRRKCQGSCLGHKFDSFNILEKQDYKLLSQYNLAEMSFQISKLDESVNYLNSIFGKPKQKIKVYFFKNKSQMLYYSGMYHYPDWVTGFAFNNVYYQYINSENPAGFDKVTHELCHIYIYHNKKSDNLPLWLEEGFCEYLNNKSKNNSKLNTIIKSELIPFGRLSYRGRLGLLEHNMNPLDRNTAYLQSLGFVDYIINRFGMDVVMKLLTDGYANFKKHFEELTSHKAQEIEDDWLRNMVRKE